MPAVSDILDTIKNLGLVGIGDSVDDTRIMGYMNLVYKETYRKTAQQRPTLLLTTENVTITSGAGNLSVSPFAIRVVKDIDNGYKKLEPTTLPDLDDKDTDLTAAGPADWYYMTGTAAINTYPVNSTTLQVRYVPAANILTSTSAETDIKIPPEFHDILVWGTLIYLNFDERDKAMSGEVNLAQSKYELALGEFIQWLGEGQTREPLRTKVVFGG